MTDMQWGGSAPSHHIAQKLGKHKRIHAAAGLAKRGAAFAHAAKAAQELHKLHGIPHTAHIRHGLRALCGALGRHIAGEHTAAVAGHTAAAAGEYPAFLLCARVHRGQGKAPLRQDIRPRGRVPVHCVCGKPLYTRGNTAPPAAGPAAAAEWYCSACAA